VKPGDITSWRTLRGAGAPVEGKATIRIAGEEKRYVDENND
jgi:hypothetical protein